MINYKVFPGGYSQEKRGQISGRCLEWFQWNKPFPHIVINGFLEKGVCEEIVDGFPSVMQDRGRSNRGVAKGKAHAPQMDMMTEVQRAFFEAVHSGKFLDFLSRITGIERLYGDPQLQGGGLHESVNGGFLKVHADFNRGLKNKHRALNMMLYLNPVWKEEWGGCLELWDKDCDERVKSILPLNNRMVLFRTSENSWHGHPRPLNVPEGVTRKSLAVYYYEDWPSSIEVRDTTLYVETS